MQRQVLAMFAIAVGAVAQFAFAGDVDMLDGKHVVTCGTENNVKLVQHYVDEMAAGQQQVTKKALEMPYNRALYYVAWANTPQEFAQSMSTIRTTVERTDTYSHEIFMVFTHYGSLSAEFYKQVPRASYTFKIPAGDCSFHVKETK